jgi:hypothetical protein
MAQDRLDRMDATARMAVELAMTARRIIALTAAYVVALQAALSTFAVPTIAAGPPGQICAPAADSAPPAPVAPHSPRSDCLACPALCGGGAGLASAAGAMLVRRTDVPSAESRLTHGVGRTAPRLLPPSRAPPPA